MEKYGLRVSFDNGVTCLKGNKNLFNLRRYKDCILYRVVYNSKQDYQNDIYTILDFTRGSIKLRRENGTIRVYNEQTGGSCNYQYLSRDCFYALGLGEKRTKQLEQQRGQMYLTYLQKQEAQQRENIHTLFTNNYKTLSMDKLEQIKNIING